MKIPSREFKTAAAARRFEKHKADEGFSTLYVCHGRKRFTINFWKRGVTNA